MSKAICANIDCPNDSHHEDWDRFCSVACALVDYKWQDAITDMPPFKEWLKGQTINPNPFVSMWDYEPMKKQMVRPEVD